LPLSDAEVDRILASDVPTGDQAELKDDPAIRARVAWPCRFQSDAQIEAIGREVFAKRLPEFLIKRLGDAFSEPEDAVAPTPTPTAEATPTWTTTKHDWKVSLKTKSKKCFGYGLGCIVTVSPKISWEPVIYDGDIPEDVTIEITYKIKGDKDGTITNTTEVDNQSKYYVRDEVLTHALSQHQDHCSGDQGRGHRLGLLPYVDNINNQCRKKDRPRLQLQWPMPPLGRWLPAR
jgi:hypothetical protein